MQSTVYAHYASHSMWNLNFNIEQADHWYVSWDTLFVRHNPNEVYAKYPPDNSAEGDESVLEIPDRITYELKAA